MLVKLHGKHLVPRSTTSDAPFVGRICERPDLPLPARGREILLLRQPTDSLPDGFRAYLLHEEQGDAASARDVYELGKEMRYLADGDVIRVDPRRGFVHAIYRRNSPSNSILVTERCDNYCVMCSQPPKDQDDRWILDELKDVIPLLSQDTREIGITGGEPALLGDGLVDLIDRLKRHLPKTAIHVLSNGRRFSEEAFTKRIARLRHPDLMFGIPLYSDLPEEHDYVVQARGAFSETVRGIVNLKRWRVRVEVRFVIHQDTYLRLPDFARFLTRNLLFVDHVALMGLEPVGFAKTNIDALWIDPLDYQEQLVDAVQVLARAGMNVSIYNHQLCVLDDRVHSFARKSISDWKNAYFDECANCTRRPECGGFFASASLRKSRGIHRLTS